MKNTSVKNSSPVRVTKTYRVESFGFLPFFFVFVYFWWIKVQMVVER